MDSMQKLPEDIFELDWRLLSLDFPLYHEPWQTSSHWTNQTVHVSIPYRAIDLEQAHDALCSTLCTSFRRPADSVHPIWRYPESSVQSPGERIERFSSSTIQALRDACHFPYWIQIAPTQSTRCEELISQLPALVEALCLSMHCPASAESTPKKTMSL